LGSDRVYKEIVPGVLHLKINYSVDGSLPDEFDFGSDSSEVNTILLNVR